MKKNKSSKVKDFIEDIVLLCKKYNVSISHEDTHGAFVIRDYNEENIKLFRNAFNDITDLS